MKNFLNEFGGLILTILGVFASIFILGRVPRTKEDEREIRDLKDDKKVDEMRKENEAKPINEISDNIDAHLDNRNQR